MFKKTKDAKCRFETIYEEEYTNRWTSGIRCIIQDKHTGTQYLHVDDGSGCSITPLLGSDGKVIVDLDSIEIDE